MSRRTHGTPPITPPQAQFIGRAGHYRTQPPTCRTTAPSLERALRLGLRPMSTQRGTKHQSERLLRTPIKPASAILSVVLKLLMVRESDASDHILFEDMAFKTLSMVCHMHPDLERLRHDPLDPVRNPQAWNAIVTTRKGARSFQFVVGGFLVLYHLGSAAKVDDDQDINFFTEVVLDLVATHNIREAYGFAVHRFVRDRLHGMMLHELFLKRRVRVYTASMEFDFTKPEGGMLWDMMSLAASEERRAIVERTRLGRIAGSRRNLWPHGNEILTLGYRFEGTQVVPDESERERIGRLLRLMADPNMSMRQFAGQAGDLGITRPRLRSQHGESATIADVKHPKDFYHSLVNSLPLYRTGVYEMHLPNPSPNVEVFGGLPVYRDDNDPEDDGFVVLQYDFGLPEGGWAPPEVFEAIMAKVEANSAFVNGLRNRRPFGGRPAYEVDGVRYQLDSNTGNGYRLRRFTTSSAVSVEMESHATEAVATVAAETIATFEANTLHLAVISGVVDALSSEGGVTGVIEPNVLRTTLDPEERFELTLEHHERRAARAREEMLRTENASTASAFRIDAEREEAVIKDLLAHAIVLRTEDRLTDPSVGVAVRPLIDALAGVANCGQKVPGAIWSYTMEILPEIHLYSLADQDEVGWMATLRIPTTGNDVLRLGPISGTVACRASYLKGRKRGGPGHFMTEYAAGESISHIAGKANVGGVAVWNLVRSELVQAGFPSGGLARFSGSPIPEFRTLVAAVAVKDLARQAKDLSHDESALAALLTEGQVVPGGCDPAWAAASLSAYLGPLSARTHWSLSNQVGQSAVDLAVAGGGVTTVGQLIQELGSLSRGKSALVHSLLGTGPGSPPSVLESIDELRKVGRMGFDPEAELRPVTCPHCGAWADLVLRVTEVPRHLLCSTCRRSPSTGFTYPDSYFALPRGLDRFPAEVSDPNPTKPSNKHTRMRKKTLTKADRGSIVAAYQDASKPIQGADGILETHHINSALLYQIVDEAGVARRHPYRPRKGAKESPEPPGPTVE